MSAPVASLAAPENTLAHSKLAEIEVGFGAGGSLTFPPIPTALPWIAGGTDQTALFLGGDVITMVALRPRLSALHWTSPEKAAHGQPWVGDWHGEANAVGHSAA